MSRNQSRRGGNGANSIACLNAIANKSEKSKRCKRDRSDEWLADARDVETLRNLAFETYYKGRVVPTKEWNDFTLALHRSLPLALRINRNIPCASKIKQYIYSKLANVFETTPIKFYHNEFALQCTASRGELKRNVTFKSLKRLITALNDGGYLSRQETVSMIPVVLLNVQPGDVVLDMCAAPGSKTTQILEMLITGMVDIDIENYVYMEHGSNCCNNYDHHTHNVVKNHTTYFEPYVNTVTGTNLMTSNTSNKNKISNSNNSNSNSNNSNSNSNITELASQITLSEHGVLVANDVNTSRLDVLVHQTNRVPHCHPHLIITNYDAARFPSLILSSQQSEKAINRASSLSLEEKEQYEEEQEKEEEEEEEQEEEEQSEEQTTYELPPQENVQSEIDPVSE